MFPWLKLSKQDVVRLPVKSILLVTDLDTGAEQQYLDFIQGTAKTIQTSRSNLASFGFDEQMFSEEDNDFEEEEDDDDREYRHGRTIH